MPLRQPGGSAAVRQFPRIQLRGVALFRVFRHRDPLTGERRQPFYFTSDAGDPGTGGRYDLPPPRGACYLARSPIGAWLEKFRSTLVDPADLRARRLLATSAPYSLAAADLTAPAARGFGVTGEIHTTGDYETTRAWASGLYRAGFHALHSKVRHDPALAERSVTLFDEAGEHPPYGWRWRTETGKLEEDGDLRAEATRCGFTIAAPPFEVDVQRPG